MGIFSSMEQRALNTPDWWPKAWGGGVESGTGIVVNEDVALGASAIWAGTRIISESIASIPLGVFERRSDDGRDIKRDHPLHKILHNSPNEFLTALEFREMQMANAILGGNAFAEIVRDGAGRVRELWPLWPHRVTIHVKNERVYYLVSVPDGKDKILTHDEVLHIRGFSRGGLAGLDPIQTNSESVGLSLALQKYQAKFFGNSARPGGVLEHPGTMKEDAQTRFKKAWEDAHRGLDQSHRVAILEEGMSWKQMGVSPEQAQMIEGRQFQLGEVARVLNIPPHLLRDLLRATFTNIEHQSIEYVRYTVRPWAVRLEQRYNMQLLSDSEQDKFFTKHILEGLMRGDMKSRFEAYAIARNNGWKNANEIRALEDENPIPGDAGSSYLVQGAMTPTDKAGEMGAPPPARSEKRTEQRTIDSRKTLRGAYAKIFEDVAERILKGEIGKVSRAVKKNLRDATDLRVWIDEFYEGHGSFVSDAFFRSFLAYAEVTQGIAATELGADPTQTIDAFAREYSDSFGEKWASSSAGQLKAIMRDTDPEDLESALLLRLDEWGERRGFKVGRREAIDAGEAFVIQSYQDLGVTRIKSKAIGESCPYCRALDGRVVGIDETMLPAGEFFPEGAEAPMKVRRDYRHPQYHDGCDCIVVPA